MAPLNLLSLTAAVLLAAAAAVPASAALPAAKVGLSLLGSAPFPNAEQVRRWHACSRRVRASRQRRFLRRFPQLRARTSAVVRRRRQLPGAPLKHAVFFLPWVCPQVAYDDKAKVAYVIGGTALAVSKRRPAEQPDLPGQHLRAALRALSCHAMLSERLHGGLECRAQAGLGAATH